MMSSSRWRYKKITVPLAEEDMEMLKALSCLEGYEGMNHVVCSLIIAAHMDIFVDIGVSDAK